MPKSKKGKILLVEDEAINLALLQEGLQGDYELLAAQTGEKAIQSANQDNPDLILLDIGLPDISGYDVCRTLKKDPQTSAIPIMFISGLDDPADEVKGLELGASDYVTKPFVLPLVKARVRNQMRLKKKTDLLEQLVSLDGLTDIPNRRQFEFVFDTEWRRAQRKGQCLALAIFDIDHFKAYNDHYGHAAGDTCLVKVAQLLEKQAKRAGDFVARYGGEEFALLIPDCSFDEAFSFCEKLRESVHSMAIAHQYSSCAEVVTVSVGLACQVPNKQSAREAFFVQADQQLYSAKEAGRNKAQGINLESQ